MKRHVISVLLLAAMVAGFWIYWESTAERRNANRIISAIEAYRESHGRLPDSSDQETMKHLGFELRVGWHPDYQVGEKGLYRLTILDGFDGPYWVYESFSQRWRKDFPPMENAVSKHRSE
jgi:hypothetical protein